MVKLTFFGGVGEIGGKTRFGSSACSWKKSESELGVGGVNCCRGPVIVVPTSEPSIAMAGALIERLPPVPPYI